MHPSIVSLPLLCSKQQPSSAFTVKFATLQVDRNSSALLKDKEKGITNYLFCGEKLGWLFSRSPLYNVDGYFYDWIEMEINSISNLKENFETERSGLYSHCAPNKVLQEFSHG